MNRRNRRQVKIKPTAYYEETSDSHDSDEDTSLLERFLVTTKSRAAGSARKRNTSKKDQKKFSASHNNSRPQNNLTQPVTSSQNHVIASINLDDSVIADQSKKVEDKVESFFKAHNLISDDEDENPIKKARLPSKGFYEISDSDDDINLVSTQPSSSHLVVNNNIKPSSSNNTILEISDTTNDEVTEVVDIPSSSKEDKLMSIVDKILDNTDENTDVVPQLTWTDYKTKNQELLGSISNLLAEMSNNPQLKTVEPPKPTKLDSPKPTKPTCPVCFEVLGGNVPVMTTMCGHLFCKTCIQHIAKTIRRCPTCRKTINQKKIHQIYL